MTKLPLKSSNAREIATDQVALIKVQSTYAGASAVASIFLSLYLFDIGGFRSIALFYTGDYVVQSLFFAVSGYLLRSISTRKLVGISLLVSCLVYVILLSLGHDAPHYVLLLGGLMGVADGLYWANINVSEYASTHAESRNSYLARLFSANAFAQVVAPLIAGGLLTVVALVSTKQNGYYSVFCLLIATWLVAYMFSRKMPALSGAHYRLKDSLTPSKPAWKLVLLQNFLDGIWVQPMLSFSAVLLFLILGSTLSVSIVSSATTIIVGCSSLFVGRLLQRRPSTYWLGAVIIPVGLLGFALFENWTGVLFYAVGVQVFYLFSNISSFKVMYDVMDDHGRPWFEVFHFVVEREVILNIGRVIGYMGVYMLLGDNNNSDSVRTGLLIIAVVPFLVGIVQFLLQRMGAYPSSNH